MAKYYNADTLLEFVKQNTPNIDGETTMECVERAIKEAPTADVVEVKHGHWIKRGNEKKCSVCGFIYYSNNDEWNGCPNCLAKMDVAKNATTKGRDT